MKVFDHLPRIMIESPHPLLKFPKLSPKFLTGIVIKPRLKYFCRKLPNISVNYLPPVHVGDPQRAHVLQTNVGSDT